MKTTDKVSSEYDFSNGIKGKHHKNYSKGTNVVLLKADVAEVFKDSESVNNALRMLMDIAKKETSGRLIPHSN